VDGVLNNFERNPTLSIEICKALIEGVCKTILTDKGNRIPEQFPKLVIETLNSLNINNHPDYEHINQLFSRLNGVIQYIGEIRNSVGCYASHGQDIEHKKPTKDLALFVSHTTNSVLGFILHLYIFSDDLRINHRIRYEDYAEFNQFLDEEYAPKFPDGLSISYSLALFEQDIEAYKGFYEEYISLEQERLQETL
ncbi:abortive infection family protein, partial [Actinobacillus suis]